VRLLHKGWETTTLRLDCHNETETALAAAGMLTDLIRLSLKPDHHQNYSERNRPSRVFPQ